MSSSRPTCPQARRRTVSASPLSGVGPNGRNTLANAVVVRRDHLPLRDFRSLSAATTVHHRHQRRQLLLPAYYPQKVCVSVVGHCRRFHNDYPPEPSPWYTATGDRTMDGCIPHPLFDHSLSCCYVRERANAVRDGCATP
uniref:Uncharacterized protein n=1 Tax=Panagrellus redivivus TaxID=6233 RepID=A0A7E4W9R8_PANRE